ncbi:hypothetical protein [Shinella sp. BYT-45]|uniref:hypothetical protein n=1 Tax=Shinella sp. BYT-45 TaxID=3377377 RepID=UPI0039802F2E
MSVFCVSISIADKNIDGRTCEERRQSVFDAFHTDGRGLWQEMTSFFLVESELSAVDLAKKVSSRLSRTDDFLLVFDPFDMTVGYFGPFTSPEVLESYFTHTTRV